MRPTACADLRVCCDSRFGKFTQLIHGLIDRGQLNESVLLCGSWFDVLCMDRYGIHQVIDLGRDQTMTVHQSRKNSSQLVQDTGDEQHPHGAVTPRCENLAEYAPCRPIPRLHIQLHQGTLRLWPYRGPARLDFHPKHNSTLAAPSTVTQEIADEKSAHLRFSWDPCTLPPRTVRAQATGSSGSGPIRARSTETRASTSQSMPTTRFSLHADTAV